MFLKPDIHYACRATDTQCLIDVEGRAIVDHHTIRLVTCMKEIYT